MVEIECPVSSLIFAEITRLQCMHGCSHYKRNPMCPPFCKDTLWFKQLLKSYERVKILYEIIDFADNHDLAVKRNIFNSKLLEIEHDLKKKGKYFALCFISGACTMCENKPCNLAECKRVHVGRTSICALGIDIMHICTEILHLPLKNSLTFWKTNFSKDFFDDSSHRYLCLGLILY